MYGSLDLGQIDVSQILTYMADMWNMFSGVIFLVLAIAGFAAVMGLAVSALIRALQGR